VRCFMTYLKGLILYASHLIISLYDVSSSKNIVTHVKNMEQIVKRIRHARWFVIRQYWSVSGCLTIITLPPSECRWLRATSDWDGRRNHNNLTFDDDTIHIYIYIQSSRLSYAVSCSGHFFSLQKDTSGLESTVHSSARHL
jgi:hypothetical protein